MRPGVLVAAAGAAVVVGGDDQAVLALASTTRRGHFGDQVERVVPGGRLQVAVAPDQRLGQALRSACR